MKPYQQKASMSHQRYKHISRVSSISQQSVTSYAALLPLIFHEQYMYLPIIPLPQKESEDSVQTVESTAVITKGCNCKKSQCLKQYCDCFAEGKECTKDCQCHGCHNQQEYRSIRDSAMLQILKRDPKAFSQKIEEVKDKKTHIRGCNCKKSGCQKKYCECYQAGVPCMGLCKCSGCQNVNGSDHQHHHIPKKICLYV